MAHARRPLTAKEARAVILLNTTYKDNSVLKEIQARFAGIISIGSSDEDYDSQSLHISKEVPLLNSNDAFLDEPDDFPPEESSQAETTSLSNDLNAKAQASATRTSEDPNSESTLITLNMEDSIVEYFEAASQPTSGLISKNSDAKLDLAATKMDILCVDEQDTMLATKKSL